MTSTYYHIFFPTQNLNLRHTHKKNGKKIEDFGNARSPFDNHPLNAAQNSKTAEQHTCNQRRQVR